MFDVATDDKTDNWFAALPSCLPYNTFTLKVCPYNVSNHPSRMLSYPRSRYAERVALMMQKLSVKKNIRYYWDFLQECEETGLEELRKLVDAGKAEYEEKKKLEETKFQEALAKWGELFSHLLNCLAAAVRSADGRQMQNMEQMVAHLYVPDSSLPDSSETHANNGSGARHQHARRGRHIRHRGRSRHQGAE